MVDLLDFAEQGMLVGAEINLLYFIYYQSEAEKQLYQSTGRKKIQKSLL
jgi:hypothetical protein